MKQNIGKVAIQRGPLVYCLEEIDNDQDYTFQISHNTKFEVEHRADLLGGVTVIKSLAHETENHFQAIPYYAWDNRHSGWMRVWLDDVRMSDDENVLYF